MDGEMGSFKTAADGHQLKASKSGEVSLLKNARGFHRWAALEHHKLKKGFHSKGGCGPCRRHAHWAGPDEVDRNITRFDRPRCGIRSVHQFVTAPTPGKVMAGRLSCHDCNCCASLKGFKGPCDRAQRCGEWVAEKVKALPSKGAAGGSTRTALLERAKRLVADAKEGDFLAVAVRAARAGDRAAVVLAGAGEVEEALSELSGKDKELALAESAVKQSAHATVRVRGPERKLLDLKTTSGMDDLDGDFRTPLGKRVKGEMVFDCELMFAQSPGTNLLSATGQCFPCLVSAVRAAVKMEPRVPRSARSNDGARPSCFKLSSAEKGRVSVALTS